MQVAARVAHPVIHRTRGEVRESAVSRVIKTMRENLCEPLTLHDMSDIANFSPYHFNRLFKEFTGLPPNQFLYSLRLQRAKELLVRTDFSVTEVCLEVGYNSIGSFTNRFTSLVGVSPNVFREVSSYLSKFPFDVIRPMIESQPDLCGGANGPSGTIEVPENFDGLIFAGLFKRAIPEGAPISCLLKTEDGKFEFSPVKQGTYYVFSVAVPWGASMRDLLTLASVDRGRSEKVIVDASGRAENIKVKLSPVDPLQPPILAAIPLMVVGKFTGAKLTSSCDQLLGSANDMLSLN